MAARCSSRIGMSNRTQIGMPLPTGWPSAKRKSASTTKSGLTVVMVASALSCGLPAAVSTLTLT